MSYQGMEEDRRFILATLDELEQYLSSSVILWRLRNTTQPLSPGNLLLALVRLKTINERPEIHDDVLELEGLIDANRLVWENRTRQEIPLRLNQYRDLVDEYLEQGTIDAGYRSNISTRVKLELLFNGLVAAPMVEQRKVDELDRKFYGLVREGAFIWEPELEKCFSKSIYGYLYVRGK